MAKEIIKKETKKSTASSRKTVSKTVKPAKKEVKSSETKVVAKKQAPVSKSVSKSKSVTKEVKEKSSKFAVIEISGQQVKVNEGYAYTVIKIEGNKGDKITNEKVLLIADKNDVKIGKPYIKGAKVVMEIETQKKDKKVEAFKYKAKSRYRKSYGYRELITRFKVLEIVG